MAGFYGNISASNRTAFTFDRVYKTRTMMDSQCATDGVFIGRYVLIEYDEPPITGYYYDGEFYGDVHFTHETTPSGAIVDNTEVDISTLLTKVEGQIYQDLFQKNSANSFYICTSTGSSNELNYQPYTAANASPFAAAYNTDVTNYGRGYDSTVWMKHVDTTTGNYRYVMIAELNTVVPNFHLVIDPPNTKPISPYFDGNSTTLDYYMHTPAVFGHEIHTLGSSIAAPRLTSEREYAIETDADITYRTGEYKNSGTTWETWEEEGHGDIFWNDLGFTMDRNYLRKAENGEEPKNAINYIFKSSGQKYYGEQNAAVGTNGVTANDTYSWYIHLPGIGNAIAKVWNAMFTEQRLLQLLQEDFGNQANCTIDSDSIFGRANTMTALIGRTYSLGNEALTQRTSENTVAIEKAHAVANHLQYTADEDIYYGIGTSAGNTMRFNKMMLYQDSHTGGDDNIRSYYLPSYTNVWTEDANGEYWFDDTVGAYKVANKSALPTGTQYYRREAYYNDNPEVPHFRFTKVYQAAKPVGRPNTGQEAVANDLTFGSPSTVRGAIALVNRIVGLNLSNEDSRDDRTLIGMINRARDMIENVDMNLAKNRFVITTADTGKITMAETKFPYNDIVPQIVNNNLGNLLLDNKGNWRYTVSYTLDTLDLSYNNTASDRYFDVNYTVNGTAKQGYYGNSCLHAVTATDTLGEAIKKMQHEMADIQYIEQMINSFKITSSDAEQSGNNILIEAGRGLNNISLSYTLNKGPRQDLKITRSDGVIVYTPNAAVFEKNYYVTNKAAYDASAVNTVTDSNVITGKTVGTATTWTLSVTDERDVTKTASVKATWAYRAYWGVGDDNTLANLNSFSKLGTNLSSFNSILATAKISKTISVNAGATEHIYYLCPASWARPTFKVGGFEGGFDNLGNVDFTNEYNETASYTIWQSSNKNLGSTSVVLS